MKGPSLESASTAIDFSSWGILVIEGPSARFLWFDGPDAMASALLGCLGRKSTAEKDDRSAALAEVHRRYLSEELHVSVLLKCLVDTLQASNGHGERSILWWGPFYDLAYSDAETPATLRRWFRERAGENGDSTPQSALKPAESDRFVRFIDEVSFGIEAFERGTEAT